MDGHDGAERRPFPGNLDESRHIGDEIVLTSEQPHVGRAADDGWRNTATAIECRGNRRHLGRRKRTRPPLDILLMSGQSKVHLPSLG